MSDYFFIQSQDPYTETRVSHQYQLARQLASAGHNVTLLLVQNGVTPARRDARSAPFEDLLASKVRVVADAFSIQQRELNKDTLKDTVRIGDVSDAIDAMLAGHKVIWN